MALGEHRRAVGAFSSRDGIENALCELRDAGFDLNKVSVIARNNDTGNQVGDVETQENFGNQADEGAAGAFKGGVFGGITGLLVGLGSFTIPGVGSILLAGEIATTLATTIAGAGIGAATGGLLGALVALGIPEKQALIYNQRIERGDYLLILNGTEAETNRAEVIVRNHGIEEFEIYHAPNPASEVKKNENNENIQAISLLFETLRSRHGFANADKHSTDSSVVIVDRREPTF